MPCILPAYNNTTLFSLFFSISISANLQVMPAHIIPGMQYCFNVRPMSRVGEPPLNQHWVSLMWLRLGYIISAGMQLNTQ